MSDYNNSNNGNDRYREFWQHANNRQSENGSDNKDKEAASPSYYRYGPFHSAGHEDQDRRKETAEPATIDDRDVEVTVPEPIRPTPAEKVESAVPQGGYPAAVYRKRSSWKSIFASFMAGVVVVGGLMFASDKADLFTTDKGVFGSPNGTSSDGQKVQSSGDGGSSVQNAALEIVRPNNISQIVANSRAAVAKIETYAKASNRSRNNGIYEDPFFQWFFGDQPPRQETRPSNQLQKVGEGSGFLFDSEGYILTNQHVVDGADEIKVYLEGHDKPFTATKLGESVDLDLAALKIKGDKPFPFLKLGDVDQLNVGDWVVAIGNPYGFDHTVTVGVLSAKERPITIPDGQVTRQYEHLLQTDASINPGNSGGPLLNLNGEVIGINTAVNAQAQGIGFAIPTSTISDVLDNLKNDKPIPREPAPYVGVYLGELDGAAAEELGYKGTDGALVTQVEVGGPANKAGIQAWDIITEVAGTKVKTYEDVSKTVQKQKVGDKITMKVFRNGKMYEVAIIVGDRNAQQQ